MPTKRQISNLKRKIAKSPNAGTFAKKAAIWLIDQSGDLTESVMVVTTNHSLGQAAAFGIHGMNSDLGKTHLNRYLRRKGIPAQFSSATLRRNEKGQIIWGFWNTVGDQHPWSQNTQRRIPMNIQAINRIVLPE